MSYSPLTASLPLRQHSHVNTTSTVHRAKRSYQHFLKFQKLNQQNLFFHNPRILNLRAAASQLLLHSFHAPKRTSTSHTLSQGAQATQYRRFTGHHRLCRGARTYPRRSQITATARSILQRHFKAVNFRRKGCLPGAYATSMTAQVLLRAHLGVRTS